MFEIPDALLVTDRAAAPHLGNEQSKKPPDVF